jgi:hypothetical protein
VLAEALGHDRGRLTVFPPEGKPFQLATSQLVPLERRSLAAVSVETVSARDVSVTAPRGTAEVRNQPLGAFALWGFPDPTRKES